MYVNKLYDKANKNSHTKLLVNKNDFKKNNNINFKFWESDNEDYSPKKILNNFKLRINKLLSITPTDEPIDTTSICNNNNTYTSDSEINSTDSNKNKINDIKSDNNNINEFLTNENNNKNIIDNEYLEDIEYGIDKSDINKFQSISRDPHNIIKPHKKKIWFDKKKGLHPSFTNPEMIMLGMVKLEENQKKEEDIVNNFKNMLKNKRKINDQNNNNINIQNNIENENSIKLVEFVKEDNNINIKDV